MNCNGFLRTWARRRERNDVVGWVPPDVKRNAAGYREGGRACPEGKGFLPSKIGDPNPAFLSYSVRFFRFVLGACSQSRGSARTERILGWLTFATHSRSKTCSCPCRQKLVSAAWARNRTNFMFPPLLCKLPPCVKDLTLFFSLIVCTRRACTRRSANDILADILRVRVSAEPHSQASKFQKVRGERRGSCGRCDGIIIGAAQLVG